MDRVIERADRGAAAEQAATALLDAAGTLSAGFWAPAAVSFSPPVDVAEEVEQRWVTAQGPARGRMPPRTACLSARRLPAGNKAATESQARR